MRSLSQIELRSNQRKSSTELAEPIYPRLSRKFFPTEYLFEEVPIKPKIYSSQIILSSGKCFIRNGQTFYENIKLPKFQYKKQPKFDYKKSIQEWMRKQDRPKKRMFFVEIRRSTSQRRNQ